MREFIWKPYFDQFPLTDRVTHYREIWAAFLVGIFMGGALTLVPIIARRIGMSSTGITVMLSMPFVGNLFSLYFGHHVQKRRDTMPFVFWPGVTSRLLVVAVAFFSTPIPFLVIMSFYYLISTIPAPAYASIMRTNYSDPHRGKIMSNIRIIRTVMSAGLAYLAGHFLDLNPEAYRWILPLSGCFGIGASIVFKKIRVRQDRSPQAVPLSFRRALRTLREDRQFLVFMLIFFFCAGPSKMAIPLEPIFFVDELAFGYRDAGLILGALSPVMSVIGFVLWGIASKKVRPLYLIVVMFLLGNARYLVLALATSPVHVIPASVLSGLSMAAFELIPLFVMIGYAGSRLSLYIAFHSTLVGLRGIVGPFVGNYLFANRGMSIVSIFWTIWIMTTVAALAMLIFAIVSGRSGGRSAETAAA